MTRVTMVEKTDGLGASVVARARHRVKSSLPRCNNPAETMLKTRKLLAKCASASAMTANVHAAFMPMNAD
jgi:hypothetical protein